MTPGVEQKCNWEAAFPREVAAGAECGQLEQGGGADEPERGGVAVEDQKQLWPPDPGGQQALLENSDNCYQRWLAKGAEQLSREPQPQALSALSSLASTCKPFLTWRRLWMKDGGFVGFQERDQPTRLAPSLCLNERVATWKSVMDGEGQGLLRQRLKVNSNLSAHKMQTFFALFVSLNGSTPTKFRVVWPLTLTLIWFDLTLHAAVRADREFSPPKLFLLSGNQLHLLHPESWVGGASKFTNTTHTKAHCVVLNTTQRHTTLQLGQALLGCTVMKSFHTAPSWRGWGWFSRPFQGVSLSRSF